MSKQPFKDHFDCAACDEDLKLDFDFTMAFQPIVDIQKKSIYAYEALVRGLNNEPASQVLCQVTAQTRYWFDQACRMKAIELAAQLKMQTRLHINFLPNAVYRPETCIRKTLQASTQFGFPVDHITFEITEGEKIEDHAHLVNIIQEYKRLGFKTAIDDFGAGYAGLNLLAEFQPDIVKIDMELTRGIDQDKTRQAIVRAIVQVCQELNIELIAEGVETLEEVQTLERLGFFMFQGYYFAKPAFRQLATYSDLASNPLS